MRTYTCDICGVVTSNNAMRDRRLLQVSYMGKEIVLDLRFSSVLGELDICRQCQEHIITSIFKKNCVTEMTRDSLRKLAGGYAEGPSEMQMGQMQADTTAETSR